MINSNCALDCMNVATDIKIAGMMGQLVQHESDNDIHVTKEEKEKLKSITNDSEDNSDLTEIKLTLNNKADKDEIPTKLSQLENDTNFISSIPDFYTTEEEVKLLIEGYLEDYDGSGGSGGAFSIQDDNLTSSKNGTVELTSNGLKIVSPTQSSGVEDSYIAFNTVNQKNGESTQFNSAAYIYNHGKESGQNYAALYINCDGSGNTYGILNASTTNTNGLVNNGVLVNNICPVTTTMNLDAYPFSKFIHYGSSTCTLNLPTNPADGMDIEFIVTNPRGKLNINTTNSNTILYIKDGQYNTGNVNNVSSYTTGGAGIWRLIFLGQIQQLGPSTQAWFAFRITDNYTA